MRLILFLLLTVPAFAARYDCTWTGGGSDPTDWTDAGNWTLCNGTYPHNTGGDTYTAYPTYNGTLDLSSKSITLGHSISNWAVTLDPATDKLTCVSVSCPFVDGMIIQYMRQYNVGAFTTLYPTGLPTMTRMCVTGASGSPVSFSLLLDNCGGSAITWTATVSGTYYAREYQPALRIGTNTAVVVGSGTLRLQGDVRIDAPSASRCTLSVGAGGNLVGDSSLSTNPTMTSYAYFQLSGVAANRPGFCAVGSSTTPAYITSDLTNSARPMAKYVNPTYDGSNGGDLTLAYADVSCVGLSSGTAGNQLASWINTTTGNIDVTNSYLHPCGGGTTVGPIYWGTQANGVATNIYRFEDSRWLGGSDGCSGFVIGTTNAPSGAGVRSFKRSIHTCRFGDANNPAMAGADFQYNVFINNPPNIGAAVWNSWYYNLMINSDLATGVRLSGASSTPNVHHGIWYARVGGNIRGWYPANSPDLPIYEYFISSPAQGTSATDGDLWMSRGTGTGVTLRNAIFAPNWTATVGPRGFGNIGTGGATITPWTLHNLTMYNGPGRVAQGNVTATAMILAESGVGAAGSVANYQGNLIYGDFSFTPNNGFHFTGSNVAPGPVTNTATASGAQFNGCFVVGGSCGTSSVYFSTNGSAAAPWTGAAGVSLDNFGTHYDVPMTGGTVPGANDMDDVNPGFQVHRRTMETYVVSRGGAGNVAGVNAYWSGLSTSQLESEITSAFNYLFYAWTPFNIRYSMPSSSANGKYLGAVRPSVMFGAIF